MLSVIEHINARQMPARISSHRLKHPTQPRRQNLDTGRIDIGAKLHHPTDPGRLPGLGEPFSELERQIPTSSLDISVQRRDLHITQRHRSRGITTILGEVLPPQRHLEQRMMSQRPGRVEPPTTSTSKGTS